MAFVCLTSWDGNTENLIESSLHIEGLLTVLCRDSAGSFCWGSAPPLQYQYLPVSSPGLSRYSRKGSSNPCRDGIRPRAKVSTFSNLLLNILILGLLSLPSIVPSVHRLSILPSPENLPPVLPYGEGTVAWVWGVRKESEALTSSGLLTFFQSAPPFC